MGKSGENEPGAGTPSLRARDSQIFICDASAEAGRLLIALQSRGYAIVDVPLGLLPSRVNYEVPRVVICDADAHEASRHLREMLALAAEDIAVTLIAAPGGQISNDPDLRALAKLVIPRPIDIDTAVEKVGALTGFPAKGSHRPRIGLPSRSPVLVASARKPYRSDGYSSSKASSSHPPSSPEASEDSPWPTDQVPSRGPGPADGVRAPYEAGATGRPPGASSAPPSSGRLSLSSETRSVLEEGRKKVQGYPQQSSPRPIRLAPQVHESGEDVRVEFLSALAEPLGDSDLYEAASNDLNRDTSSAIQGEGGGVTPGEGERRPSQPTGPTGLAGIVGVRRRTPSDFTVEEDDEPTNPGGRSPTLPPDASPEERDSDYLLYAEVPPALDDLSDLLTAKSSRPPPSLPAVSVPTERPQKFDSDAAQLIATVPTPSRIAQPSRSSDILSTPVHAKIPLSRHPPHVAVEVLTTPPPRRLPGSHSYRSPESNLNKRSALYAHAQAIQERMSGAVAQQDGIGLRRIVLTDGDISTVTSTSESESLAHFLASRGDISASVLQSLGSIPGFGRHAGAALIARGLLQQEDLWPVLRAHAEWILGHALLSQEETQLEKIVPARILEEPAVFGGAAGTEIYLDTVRRVVSPDQAYKLLGSGERVLGMGRHESLLGESALDQTEQQQILDAVGKPLSQLKNRRPDLLSVVLALTYLGVFSTGGEAPEPPAKVEEDLVFRSDEMDDEAFVNRVMNRRALVENGDYFSILGIPRSATAFEIDRARDELLSEYSEERLTARTVHLQEDLHLLRQTIDEAHLVLRDEVRRMRYRAALEALPD